MEINSFRHDQVDCMVMKRICTHTDCALGQPIIAPSRDDLYPLLCNTPLGRSFGSQNRVDSVLEL